MDDPTRAYLARRADSRAFDAHTFFFSSLRAANPVSFAVRGRVVPRTWRPTMTLFEMTPLRTAVSSELQSWFVAKQAVLAASRAREEKPDDPVRQAQLDRAQAEQREAADLLKAALRCRGYTFDDLKAEIAKS